MRSFISAAAFSVNVIASMRRDAVKGSHERYQLTSWAWTLLWPTYAWLAVVAGALVLPGSALACALAFRQRARKLGRISTSRSSA